MLRLKIHVLITQFLNIFQPCCYQWNILCILRIDCFARPSTGVCMCVSVLCECVYVYVCLIGERDWFQRTLVVKLESNLWEHILAQNQKMSKNIEALKHSYKKSLYKTTACNFTMKRKPLLVFYSQFCHIFFNVSSIEHL